MHTSSTVSRTASSRALLIMGIVFIASCLRAPITVLGPLLDPIRTAAGLGVAQAGMLTTLPLLAFAVVSPWAATMSNKYGLERMLFWALAVLLAGILVRSAGPTWALFGGTCLMGGSIAVANVLLPSLLKRDFPHDTARLTAYYALAMILAAGVMSTVVVPFHELMVGNWRLSLASVAVLPLIAMVSWWPQLYAGAVLPPQPAVPIARGTVWRSMLAWQVAAYLGLTCFIHFAAIAWLPAILLGAGFSPAQAGVQHGWMQLAGIVPALALGPLLRRLPDQRWLAFVSPALSAVALLGFMVLPRWATGWSFAFGVGMGSALILSLAFVGLRAPSQQVAASLSGMAQCVGYLLAAVGPTLFGALQEATGSWSTPLGTCVALCAVMCALGLRIGRKGHVQQ
ncbi:MFS transporter [Pusillimonas noertemannii]|nr:MFS transporter [Pusillimonas noertemannii]NYT69428.1 MFS transporter [Pusillimonas noertemannii]TFL09816.1 MFS transporter [Pusillimonas noertemannii]